MHQEKDKSTGRMRTIATIWALLGIVGCSSVAPRAPTQSYQRPETVEDQLLAKLVALPREAAAAGVLKGLSDSVLKMDYADTNSGFVIAEYGGDPEGFVDCGSITFEKGGASIPAARESFTLNDLVPGQALGGQISRDLRLDTRLMIAAQPIGARSSVSVDATHVLTKTVRIDGQVVRSEVIAFDSSGAGTFKKGTHCHSTGKLERLALDGVPGELVRLEDLTAPAVGSNGFQTSSERNAPEATARIQASQARFDCNRLVGGNADQVCQLLTLVGPYHTGALRARLMTGDSPLRTGDQLVLELDLPGEGGDVHLSFIDSAGTVTHLPTVRTRDDVRHSMYATGHKISEPLGQGVVLVFNSLEDSVFGYRPPSEPIARYLTTLRNVLRGPAVLLDADAVLVTSGDQP